MNTFNEDSTIEAAGTLVQRAENLTDKIALMVESNKNHTIELELIEARRQEAAERERAYREEVRASQAKSEIYKAKEKSAIALQKRFEQAAWTTIVIAISIGLVVISLAIAYLIINHAQAVVPGV